MNFTITTPEPQDFETIVSIYNKAIVPFYTIYSEEEKIAFADSLIEKVENITEIVKTREIRVFKNEAGGILGYAIFRKKNDVVIWISSLYVLPESQGLGVGSELLGYVEWFAKNNGCSVVALETHRDAVWALNFYKKHRYEVVNEKVGEYPFDQILDKPPVQNRPLLAKKI